MIVKLQVGMAIAARDGEGKGPVFARPGTIFKFEVGDIIAAGFPWSDLGAQAGDTVRRVWCGYSKSADSVTDDMSEFMAPHPDSLYVIVARAALPADRILPACHFMQDGVEMVCTRPRQPADRPPARRQQLVAQGGGFYRTMTEAQTRAQVAADATPDDVITIHKRDKAYVLTFPRGGDVGTVTREKL